MTTEAALLIDSLFADALRQHQGGRLTDAEGLYRQILQIEPHHADSLHLLGVIAHQQGRDAAAIDFIGRAIELKSTSAAYYCNLGVALKVLGRPDDAVAAYDAALRLKPDFAEVHFNRGLAYTALGCLLDAVATYRSALSLQPAYADAFSAMANALVTIGRLPETIMPYRVLLRLTSGDAEAYSNLANALIDGRRPNEAVAACRAALRLKPDFAHAHSNLGIALKRLGRLAESVRAFKAALRLKPDFADAHFNLGTTMADMGCPGEAVSAFYAALGIEPDNASAFANLGVALKDLGRFEDAVASYGTALRLKPHFAEPYSNLGGALATLGRFDDALAAFAAALRINPDYAGAHSNLLLTLHYQAGTSGMTILAEAKRFASRFEDQQPQSSFANVPDPDRRLRIGYVSPDFRKHSVAWFFEPLLGAHDREKVEIFCYADVRRPDAVTERLRGKADHWRSGVGLSDAALAEIIQQDRIDILVDLAGHTAHNRLLLFARKPAPVQVSWLGYPGTTGLSRIDYRIVDAITDPPDQRESHCSETLLRLPDGFLCYGPPPDVPLPTMPGRSGSAVTFSSFNNPAKLSTATLDAWAALLARVPGARLLLKGRSFDDPAARAELLRRFNENRITDDRLTLIGHLPSTEEHLAHYHQIDIALDPFPYNGTTTICEALWMGVPVVTLRGDRHSGRVGASILHRLGLDDMVAETVDDYVAIAASLAADSVRRKQLRLSLRDRMTASTLCDGVHFARTMEDTYRTIWRRWCEAMPPVRPDIKGESLHGD